MKRKNIWKGIAELLGAPYNKRFRTDGYGDFRIDNKGLYIYSTGKESFCGYWSEDYDASAWLLDVLLSGDVIIE